MRARSGRLSRCSHDRRIERLKKAGAVSSRERLRTLGEFTDRSEVLPDHSGGQSTPDAAQCEWPAIRVKGLGTGFEATVSKRDVRRDDHVS